MTKNYIFREFECGLTREQTAELCFKSVRTITEWDKGKPIPPECKRLMRLYTNRTIGIGDDWKGFSIKKECLTIPSGDAIKPQQILLGIALIHIQAPDDLSTMTKMSRLIRKISEIKG
ncbi:regulator [Vibrio fluvialis]